MSRRSIAKRLIHAPQPGRLFATSERYGEPPVPARDDLSRVGVLDADAVPERRRFAIRVAGPSGQSVIRDRWGQEPDRPCTGMVRCERVLRALRAGKPLPAEDAAARAEREALAGGL